jgi:hypothetical protein
MGNQLQAEWAFLTGAPLLSAAFVILAVAVVWAVLHFLYRHRLEGLREELERQRARPSAPQPASEVPNLAEERDEYKDDQRRHRSILGEVASTASSIGYALGTQDHTGMSQAVPRLRAVLLTLTKAYDLKIPNLDGSPDRCLRAGSHYLMEIGAYLRLGHLDEARRCAERLSPKLDEYIAGTRAQL